MAGFYKVVLRGVASGQEVNNILYYAPAVPTGETFSESDANTLGAAVNSAWKTEILPSLASQYAFNGCDVSMVDEDGKILSPFVVSVSDSGTGGDVGAPETVAMVVIAKFNCTAVAEAAPHPVPRRSYLAIGPISSLIAGASGLVANPAAFTALFTSAFTQGHLVNATQYLPYRVGRTKEATETDPTTVLAGVGRVHSVVCRPYVSFRRSRLFSPTGN